MLSVGATPSSLSKVTSKATCHREIKANMPISGGVMTSSYRYYKFCPSSPNKLILIRYFILASLFLRVTPASAHSALSVYVSTSNEQPDDSDFEWKGIRIGEILLQIHPINPCYTTSWYYIGIMGCHFGYNSFTISVSLAESCNIVVGYLIDPIKELNNEACSAKLTLKPDETMYFVHKVKGERNNCLLCAKTTDGVALYGSELYPHPDSKNSRWSTELPDADSLETNIPFFINKKGNINYVDTLSKQPLPAKNSGGFLIEIDEAIDDFKVLYVAAKNISGTYLEPTITIKDFKEEEVVPPEIKKSYAIYNKLYEDLDGSLLSQAEREEKGIIAPEFTYGEIEFFHFLPLLRFASKGNAGIFWDLGCGTGKALIIAALSGFSKVCGVELLEGLCTAAESVAKDYQKIACSPPVFQISCKDLLEENWLNADVIYASSICFPEELMQGIIEKGKGLQKGTRIISLTEWEDPEHYKTIYKGTVKMSWGKPEVYIMEKS